MTTPLTPDCEGYLNQPQQAIYYRLYRGSAFESRRLLLLHGGGVDGQITWEPIVSRLLHWTEVLVPDLRGTGRTHFPDHQEQAFNTSDVVADMAALLDSLGWSNFDLGGYSYGGLIAMQLKAARPAAIGKTFLFEPGLLSGGNETEQLSRREILMQAAQKLRIDDELEYGLQVFLDAVSPQRNRNSRSEEIVRGRLAHRPKGLAAILEAVVQAAKQLDRTQLIAAQEHVSSFVGERSSAEIFSFCQEIAQQHRDWVCHLIPGTDHALPFQKPDAIANIMNADQQTFLAQTG
ncbi:MAG: alpha/beta hydrolase [Gammaproteobacteria bacterium]|nr:alpha/beta hydrolase [Gammaproteobacteria bacterium]MBU1733463.1 alpha/beta hydrolase [Gammaproteobacteria bacterium]MBU1891880.1 alpha/beta hydrolase [Gammaproteobacteria bacterium]